MTKHKDPQEDNEEMIREQNRREEEKINIRFLAEKKLKTTGKG